MSLTRLGLLHCGVRGGAESHISPQPERNPMCRAGITSLFVLALSVWSLSAQHSYSTAEIAEGGKLFQAGCAR